MDARQSAHLQQTITDLQARWGSQAVCTLREAAAPEGIPTGFAALDALTGVGGIPVGAITALTGPPTSGVTTLAYHLAASAQRGLRTTIWLDTTRVFDPASANASGVDFQHLLLSRPADWTRALAVTRDIAEQLLHAFLVLPLLTDATPENIRPLADLLRVLPAICHRNSTTLLLPGSGPEWQTTVLPRAALVIQLNRTAWLPDMTGLTTHATLLKSRFAPAGQSAAFEITYPELP